MKKVFNAVSEFWEDSDNRYLVYMMLAGVALYGTGYVGAIAVRMIYTP